MKRTILLCFLLMLCIQVLKAQSIFIKSGRNLTKYNFRNSTNSTMNLQKEIGQSYEFGYLSNQSENSRFYYGLSAGLEEYNASGSISTANLVWETNYVNLKGLGYFSFLNNDKFQVALKGSLGFATLIHGRQQINGTRFDLLKQDEFKGLFINPQIGLSFNLNLNNLTKFHLDYDYGSQNNLTNSTDQKLSFINQSLNLGFSFNIN